VTRLRKLLAPTGKAGRGSPQRPSFHGRLLGV
jgi:hypothetical protein